MIVNPYMYGNYLHQLHEMDMCPCVLLAQTYDIIILASIWTGALFKMWTPVPTANISVTYGNHVRQGYKFFGVSLEENLSKWTFQGCRNHSKNNHQYLAVAFN